MKITKQQLNVLDSLVVERLCDHQPDTAALVNTFSCRKNTNLENVIRSRHAFDKDEEGTTAYYVVKAPTGELLLYFSLKCGELFEQLDMHKMDLALKTRKSVYVIQNRESFTEDELIASEDFIQNNLDEIKLLLPDIDNYINKKGDYKADLSKELNSEMQRVLKTYPAIELVEFCKNDNSQSVWQAFGISRKMGECVFWHHVVPKILSVQEKVGCQYVYLFAADKSIDGDLANHYKVALGFEQSTTLGANKPHYDFQCFFLCQEIKKIIQGRNFFYAHFNPNENAI